MYVIYVSHNKSVCHLKLLYFSGSVSGTQPSQSPSGLAVVGRKQEDMRGRRDQGLRTLGQVLSHCRRGWVSACPFLSPHFLTLRGTTRFHLRTSLSELEGLSKAAQLLLGNERRAREPCWLLSDPGQFLMAFPFLLAATHMTGSTSLG